RIAHGLHEADATAQFLYGTHRHVAIDTAAGDVAQHNWCSGRRNKAISSRKTEYAACTFDDVMAILWPRAVELRLRFPAYPCSGFDRRVVGINFEAHIREIDVAKHGFPIITAPTPLTYLYSLVTQNRHAGEWRIEGVLEVSSTSCFHIFVFT